MPALTGLEKTWRMKYSVARVTRLLRVGLWKIVPAGLPSESRIRLRVALVLLVRKYPDTLERLEKLAG